MTTYEVLRYIRDFFPDTEHQYTGEVTITDGEIQTDILQDGQYYLIEGSHYNNGVYEYPTEALKDETFDGVITPLMLPPELIELIREMQEWEMNNQKVLQSPFISESFNDYSYNRGQGDQAMNWKTVWKSRLSAYKKI